MTKQEQIEEIAVIGCVRNPQAHIAEECSKCGFKQWHCNAYRHAEALYNAGYRKVDEVRKETAREILQTLYDKCYEIDTEYDESIGNFVADNDILCLAKHYGVEVEQ